MGFYRTCPYCGSNLDPNEKCECQENERKEAEQYDEAKKNEADEKAVESRGNTTCVVA